jgi:hypothetical protein
MKKISPTTIVLVIVTLVALSLALLYGYLFISLSGNVKNQEAMPGKVKNAQGIIRTEEENRNKLVSYFVTEGEQAAFVSSLESLCQSLSLSCTILSLDETTDPSGITKTLTVSVAAEGARSNISQLITRFESSQYPLIIEKAVLTAKSQVEAATSTPSEWEGVFTMTLPVLITN